MKTCTLRRCQGKRGCLCPKGNHPVGFYANPKNVANETEELPVRQFSKSVSPSRSSSSARTSPSKSLVQTTKQKLTRDPITIPSDPVVEKPSSIEISSANLCNGEVCVRYNHYKKKFCVNDGRLKADDIDKEYCLLFAYPEAKIHLSTYSPSSNDYEDDGFTVCPLIQEGPAGVFHIADIDKDYWVHIEENEIQRKQYEERQAAIAAKNAALRAAAEEKKEAMGDFAHSKVESCSCLEGNPCVDSYCCKDWNNRYEVAKKNGWKGFQ